jgi:phenol/toluene 2-monooxygenase (NADH) P2/A2
MTETPATRVRNVGVDVQDTDDTRPIVEAIERDNPEVVIRRMPGMVKLVVPREMVIQRTTVEEILGREWDTNEFQLSIISLVGNISEWDEDEIRIKWEH